MPAQIKIIERQMVMVLKYGIFDVAVASQGHSFDNLLKASVKPPRMRYTNRIEKFTESPDF